jgi:hypothetical protein
MGPSCMHGVQEAWLAAIEHSESTSEEEHERVSSALQLLGGTMGIDKMLEGQGDGGTINTIACGQPGVQLARDLLVAGRSIDTCVCTVLLSVCLSVCQVAAIACCAPLALLPFPPRCVATPCSQVHLPDTPYQAHGH